MYLLIKPIPTKYFVVHIDVATQDNLVVRISFSNLFKEFKSTSTWLQFPFICKATRGTVHAVTALTGKGEIISFHGKGRVCGYYLKILKIRTPETFAVVTREFEQDGFVKE